MSQREIRRHNETVLDELEEGDLIEFKRGLVYSHWAVYIGKGTVVHLAGDRNAALKDNFNAGSIFTICGKRFSKAFVKVDKFWDVVLGSKANKNNSKDESLTPKPKRNIVKDALEMVGEIGYNVLWKNCEHFASFCRYGVEKSDQAKGLVTWATVGISAGLTGIFLYRRYKEK